MHPPNFPREVALNLPAGRGPVGWGLWTGGLWARGLQTGGLQAGGCGLGHDLDTREPGKDRLGWQWEQDWRHRLTAPYPDCCVTTSW